MSVLHKLLSKQIIIFKQFDKVSCSQINRFRQLSIHYSNNDTNNNIVRSPFADVQIPSVSIPEYIYSQTEQFGKFVALECAITRRKYTYDDLRVKSRNLSKALRKKLNLVEGDIVAVFLPNVPEIPIVVLGSMEAGLIVTTLNPIYTPEEISRQLLDSSAKAIVTLSELYDTAVQSTKLMQKHLPILVIKTEVGQTLPEGAIDFAQFIDNVTDIPDITFRNAHDVAFLPYSSGTTGLPKGVQLTNNNIVANICQNTLIKEESWFDRPTDSHQDVVPGILPMYHIYGQTVTGLATLTQGSKIVTLPKFTPESYTNLLRDYKSHVLFVVPPIVLFLSSHPLVKSEYLSTVRNVVSGAAPLGALDEERFIKKCGKHVHIGQGYGLTETSPGVTFTPQTYNKAAGSIGVPIPQTVLKVADVNDPKATQALGPNQTGELLIKGPQVMKGYHNKPDETAAMFVDGWMRTGDLVYYNEDKNFFVTDRLKELIKVKGFQVPPAELEEIIRDHPSVDDAAVIGVDHATDGEVPRAYVVAKKNHQIDCDDLKRFVAGKVAAYKQLRGGIAVVDRIPKNLSGKILRRELKLGYVNGKKLQ